MCNNKIMPVKNFIKEITSKDIKLSQNTIKNMIEAANSEQFGQLCQNADFIFPFLKERIIKDFVKLINKENLNCLFEFSKIYSFDFEDLIVNSWIKFACEDLTDEILELFEKGCDSQKTYCAKYFSKIQDSLALEYLNKEAKSTFLPLKTNCAMALAKFGDKEVLDEMKALVLNSDDDFEKLSAFEFICAYGGENQIKFALNSAFSSPFCANILSKILDNNDINYLKNILDEKTLIRIFKAILDEYPEEIGLDSVYYWNLADFIKIIYNFKNQYANNVLMIAKQKFEEFSKNDIYTFDFDKNVKNEVRNISSLLDSLDLDDSLVECELNCEDEYQINTAIEAIKECRLSRCKEILAKFINEGKLNYRQSADAAFALKELGASDLISQESIEKIENENIKALIKSYMAIS